MVIDFVEPLQLGLIINGRRDVGDDLGFVELARKQTALLKSIKQCYRRTQIWTQVCCLIEQASRAARHRP